MTNHPPSVLWHCWLGHQICKTSYPSGTLNLPQQLTTEQADARRLSPATVYIINYIYIYTLWDIKKLYLVVCPNIKSEYKITCGVCVCLRVCARVLGTEYLEND